MTRKTSAEIQSNCLLIEEMVKALCLKGMSDNEKIVAIIDEAFQPQDEWEMGMYSEAILYAKYAVLN